MKNTINNIKTAAGKGIIIFFALLLSLSACNERFEEMNTNPNNLTEIPDDFLFASLVRNTVRDNLDRWQQDIGAQYAHQGISNAWQKSLDQYLDSHQQGDLGEMLFESSYRNCIKYANEIIAINSEEGNTNELKIAMTKALAIVSFAKLTDNFGDVPYFEAGMGKYEILLPKYDEQNVIYADMVDQLAEIYTTISNGDPANAYPGQDPLFDNNLEKWGRFVNSLRLRLAMRARFVEPGKYNAVIADCLTKPLMEDNSHNASLQHWDSERGELYNPWHNFKIEYDNGSYRYNVSTGLVDWLVINEDPRLTALVAPNKDGEYKGLPNGLTDQAVGEFTRSNLSVPGDLMLERDQPLDIMTASEIWFLRAEAALFNLGGTDANALYQRGIEESMERWEIDASDYIATSPLATLNGTTEEQFEQIGEQMWVAFIPNHIEAWANMRRTGYPVIARRTNPLLSQGVTDGYLPKRLKYPYTVEKTLNGDNMQIAIDRMGGDTIDNPVWWDVRD
ncbi:SusD/RagB family nutrient-binding outer membrane lipoprotein [Prolixibacteraceae bacterium Z1-6]|uniref:SusD/RagB family nutrient-binding outer membrane lipoprotein n=1 Tax=Draconibacterium aestuarii TaxID=2998507 RepID=A0A9X3F1W1_9BACT|nr:SusD/RagB family nutrient-binding outer membrane lipoprotein [Prolixibacteraceae bacterium Z1-6]